MEGQLLAPLVDYFYSGQITISNDNVMGLLHASSLLLLPSLVEACGQFLSNCLDESNCLDILAIATSHNFGDSFQQLERHAVRYIQLHFEAIWSRSPDTNEEEQLQRENDEDPFLKMDHLQLTKLLSADDLCADSEENVFQCLQRWLQYNR